MLLALDECVLPELLSSCTFVTKLGRGALCAAVSFPAPRLTTRQRTRARGFLEMLQILKLETFTKASRARISSSLQQASAPKERLR